MQSGSCRVMCGFALTVALYCIKHCLRKLTPCPSNQSPISSCATCASPTQRRVNADRSPTSIRCSAVSRSCSLSVTAAVKHFRALTYRNGKPHTIKLGNYPQMSVKEAREKARAYFNDPATYAAQTLPDTFKEVADNWFKRHVEAHALRSAREIKRQLETYVYPKWKERKFLDLRRGEVNDLLDNIADHNGRKQADAVLATVRNIMTWYQPATNTTPSPIVKGMRKSKVGMPAPASSTTMKCAPCGTPAPKSTVRSVPSSKSCY